jgi:hypothetical protein
VYDMEVDFTGEYAPMPFNQPPPDARYVDLTDKELDDFAIVLSKYLQQHFPVKLVTPMVTQ